MLALRVRRIAIAGTVLLAVLLSGADVARAADVTVKEVRINGGVPIRG